MASTYITRSNGSATGTTKGTISVWFKRAKLSSAQYLYGAYIDGSNRFKIELNTSDIVEINNINGGSDTIVMNTNRKLRDTNAWYHLVFKVDTTQATEADRVKLYINGVQETSFSSVTYPSQNDTNWKALNASSTIDIGAYNNGGSRTSHFDGEMAHYHFTDGYAYDASTFGETDSTSGIWTPNTSPSVTYGNNGFFLKFENSGNLDLDSSGNNLTFTTSGTPTQNVDTPENNFATLNPLSSLSNLTYENGNLQVTGASSNVWKTTFSSIGMMYGEAGKFYCEMKVSTLNSQAGIGVWGQPLPQTTTSNFFPNHHQYGFVYKEDGSVSDDSQTFYTGSSFTSGDIIQCALDLTNSKIYFGKNGTWQNSGDPTSGSTGTGAVALEDNGDAYFFTASSYGTDVLQMNFGNGYFGTTAISSEGTNASGIGKFEYDVPTGYTALSTKGLNE